MRKRIFAITAVAVMVLCMSTPAFAAARNGGRGNGTNNGMNGNGVSYGLCNMGYGFMWDEDGNFVCREVFEDCLDAAICGGFIASEYRENYMAMYDYCFDGGTLELRGNGRGCCAMYYYAP